jgi:hypothetical protein
MEDQIAYVEIAMKRTKNVITFGVPKIQNVVGIIIVFTYGLVGL